MSLAEKEDEEERDLETSDSVPGSPGGDRPSPDVGIEERKKEKQFQLRRIRVVVLEIIEEELRSAAKLFKRPVAPEMDKRLLLLLNRYKGGEVYKQNIEKTMIRYEYLSTHFLESQESVYRTWKFKVPVAIKEGSRNRRANMAHRIFEIKPAPLDLQLFVLYENDSIMVIVTTNIRVSLDLPVSLDLLMTGSVHSSLVNVMQTPFFQVYSKGNFENYSANSMKPRDAQNTEFD
ncbi:hypothetical protein BTVI_118560 [Pitangus sulphuratus]|nr:hypothetical protein BTVI_118560 [Pitangus sulphuratus]